MSVEDSSFPRETALIGLDWGSSSLRAMLIDGQGQVLRQRQSAAGASSLHGGADAFVASLDELIGDWHGTGVPVLACGMVGSAHGWREVPYAACPADAAQLAAGALAVDWRGRPVRLLPGLRCDAGTPDVMRGEETQVLGAVALRPELAEGACIVMPGTHSKWAQVQGGAVQVFATQMTGELFAVLRKHSVLGRLMADEATDDLPAFAEGVRAARDHGEEGLSHQLFSVRTLGLTGRLAASALPDYLSGLLIGHELRAGLRWREQSSFLARAPLLLIGEAALCQRYAKALDLFGLGSVEQLPNTAAAGLAALALLTEEVSP
ncbi:2-dehydro-3-deoxygalactonokinase [Pelomonas sp. SE-A7]|uniref:2-dehydro-3-deoxygalactonokinase n=1 Tax=Pelomonas sp. SE-A7 TaxID=3054953 RepID=UPI00259C8187|nr:2-dehydro-3-deoxygalactonokinase [Pelomonas sp. SE-A7]MDM4765273.1 2-dehydro-3-deoxygalactonokinase [Pelomonas sp. SE-A7]